MCSWEIKTCLRPHALGWHMLPLPKLVWCGHQQASITPHKPRYQRSHWDSLTISYSDLLDAERYKGCHTCFNPSAIKSLLHEIKSWEVKEIVTVEKYWAHTFKKKKENIQPGPPTVDTCLRAMRRESAKSALKSQGECHVEYKWWSINI